MTRAGGFSWTLKCHRFTDPHSYRAVQKIKMKDMRRVSTDTRVSQLHRSMLRSPHTRPKVINCATPIHWYIKSEYILINSRGR